jgi:putative hydrolase of the HAD superfamily
MVDITTLFWDNGGVILTNGWDRGSRKVAVEKFHLDWTEFEDRHELMLDAFEKGEITLDEYLRRTVFYEERAFTADAFKQFMFDQSQQFPESMEFLGKLARGRRYLMAALNNESLEINEYRVRKFHLRDYFPVFFSSCYLGMRKPLAGIYKQSLKITQREPAECILIDDRELNLECARELGMKTIRFQSVPQLGQELKAFGVTTDGD